MLIYSIEYSLYSIQHKIININNNNIVKLLPTVCFCESLRHYLSCVQENILYITFVIILTLILS